jgi:hypothetical protein
LLIGRLNSLSRFAAIGLCTILAITGIGFVLVGTTAGVGLSPDSIYYIAGARNLLSGAGFRGYDFAFGPHLGPALPIIHYAPLYSALLTLVAMFGIDPLLGARWVNALIFAANIGLAAYIVWSYTGGALAPTTLTAWFMLLSTTMLGIHTLALTEPLFILLMLTSLLLLAKHLDQPTYRTLFACAVAMGLAFLARYAAPPLIIAGCLSLLVLGKGRLRSKLTRSGILLVISGVPMVLWMARNAMYSGALTDRAAMFHPVSIRKIASGMRVVVFWIVLPLWKVLTEQPYLVTACAVALTCFSVAFALRSQQRVETRTVDRQPKHMRALPAVFSIFVICYTGFLLISISLFDSGTPLDDRILSPLFVILVILVACMGPRVFSSRQLHPRLRLALLACIALLAIANLHAALSWTYIAKQGQGFSGPLWTHSATIREVQRSFRDKVIFSNGPDAIYLLTGTLANMIPGTRPELEDLAEISRTQPVIIVYFKAAGWRPYEPTETELTRFLQLTPLLTRDDGTIYRVSPREEQAAP